MNIHCPQCGEALELPDNAVGAKVQCPFCETKFIGEEEVIKLAPVKVKEQVGDTEGAGCKIAVKHYVVPDGMQSDRPEDSGSPVSEDGVLYFGDGFFSTVLTCSQCGNKFIAAYRKVVNVTERPALKAAIMDGSYFRFTCPRCKNSAPFRFRMIVHDVMKRYFIRSFDSFDSLVSVHKQHSTLKCQGYGFPDEFLPFVRLRLVMGPQGLMEKMRIFEADLDDYSIEGLKEGVLASHKMLDFVDEIFFQDVTDDGRLEFHIRFNNGQSESFLVPREWYEEMKATYEGMGRFREGEFRYVDRYMMVSGESDMEDWWDKSSTPARISSSATKPSRPLQPGDVQSINLGKGLKMNFCWCPAGRFQMGDILRDEGHRMVVARDVQLTRGFWIAQTPVTQAQWQAVMVRAFKGDGDLPVTDVSWDECREFCKAVGRGLKNGLVMDLPTEAQWERAARAGTLGDFGYNCKVCDDWRDHARQVADYGWTQSNSGDHIHPVGQKKPNGWNIYDMLGNVYEYVKDSYMDDRDLLKKVGVVDPFMEIKKKSADVVMRGGCYYKDGVGCSVWERRPVGKYGIYHIGFRPVINV